MAETNTPDKQVLQLTVREKLNELRESVEEHLTDREEHLSNANQADGEAQEALGELTVFVEEQIDELEDADEAKHLIEDLADRLHGYKKVKEELDDNELPCEGQVSTELLDQPFDEDDE